MSRQNELTILLRDDSEGIRVSEAKALADSVSRIIGVSPRMTGERAQSQPDSHIRSVGALYHALGLSVEPGVISAAGAVALRNLAKVICAVIKSSRTRRAELWLSDGTHVLVTGRDATPEGLAEALSKMVNPSSAED